MFSSVEWVIAEFAEILIMKIKALKMRKYSDSPVIDNCLILPDRHVAFTLQNPPEKKVLKSLKTPRFDFDRPIFFLFGQLIDLLHQRVARR